MAGLQEKWENMATESSESSKRRDPKDAATLEAAYTFLTKRKPGISLEREQRQRHANLRKRISRMNKELVLHNFPELDFSNRSYRNPQRHPMSSSSLIIPAANFQRDRIPTTRKKKLKARLPEPPASVGISEMRTPREEMSHLPAQNSFIQVSQAIGPAYLVPCSQFPEQKHNEPFIKVDSEHYLSHRKKKQNIEASSRICTEERISQLDPQDYIQNEDTPAQSSLTRQKNSLTLSTSDDVSQIGNKQFVLTNPKLISLASKRSQRREQTEARRYSLFKRPKISGSRRSPAKLIEEMENQIEDVVKPLLQRNDDIVRRIPSQADTSFSAQKKDVEVSTMTPFTLEEAYSKAGTRPEERMLRSSPDLRYIRKTKTILQKTKKVDFYSNAKSETIIKYEAPIQPSEPREEAERYQSYRKKQEQRIISFLFEKKERGRSEKALHQSFKKDTHWLVPTLSRQYEEHQQFLRAEYGLSARGLGKKKEGSKGKGGLMRLQTKEEFAESLDKRQAAVESLRQRMLARRQGVRDK